MKGSQAGHRFLRRELSAAPSVIVLILLAPHQRSAKSRRSRAAKIIRWCPGTPDRSSSVTIFASSTGSVIPLDALRRNRRPTAGRRRHQSHVRACERHGSLPDETAH
jgi:hypothetical protein